MAGIRNGALNDRDTSADTETARPKFVFHHGEVLNYNPNRADYDSANFLQDYLLHGWMPAAPFLTRGTRITAFGSCFAANITRHLSAIGYDLASKRDPDIYISRLTDGMVNVTAILGQFEWALENKNPPQPLWHGFKAESYDYDADIRDRTRDVFLATEFFIITLGLSEIWYDEQTGDTFWRAVPASAFDPDRHKFRVLSMEETKAAIAEIHRLIRKHVPKAKILFTVSPIPLAATFRPVSCLTANAVSKAVIRAALDEFLRSHPEELNSDLFYFPSMEIVQLAFTDAWNQDGRHPASYVLDTVMKTFEATYCVDEGTFEKANAMLQMFRTQNMREIGARVPKSDDDASSSKAAKTAAREGSRVREQARLRENNLYKKLREQRKVQTEAAQPSREQRVAERQAQHEKRRKERRAARAEQP